MTAKIKLNAASGGGSFSLQAPSSSSNNRVFTLPDSADATILTSTTATGKILQVVQTFKTDAASQSGNSSTVFYDISGMSASITPSSSTNKVLVMWTAQVSSSGASGRGNLLRLLRGSSVIGASTAGTNEQVQVYDRTVQNNLATKNMMFLDTPNTTSATTYKLQWSVEGSGGSATTYYLNRNSGGGYGTTSHITLMEVEA